VAHAFHQLTKVGSCVSGQLVASMAQVVQINVKSSRSERGIGVEGEPGSLCWLGPG
jgi:hypothetical protein